MKTTKLLITLYVFLASFLVGGIALANDSGIFDSASSDSTLEAPKLAVKIDGNQLTLSWGQGNWVRPITWYITLNTLMIILILSKQLMWGIKTSAVYDLSPGSAYHVAVKACKDGGFDCSDYSNIHDVTIPLVSTFKNSLGQEFKLIPAGTFTMGSPSDEPGRSNVEIQHQVTLTQPFFMETTEVTQAQWQAVMGSNPSHHSWCPTCPVETVSWDDAQSYITKMNARGEGTYSLPTEAQWEYAARAGSTTAFYNGHITKPHDDDRNLDAIGWNHYNSDYRTHPVAQKTPNAWGLYDMSGNVWEWCQDWYGVYSSRAVTDPTGPSSGSYCVLRGGCFDDYALLCRSAVRSRHGPGSGRRFQGFRLTRAQ